MRNLHLYLLLFIFLTSCANYKLNYSPKGKNWATENIPPTDKVIRHTMYLIGDVGYVKPDKPSASLNLLKQKLDEAGENSSVIFLGDNIAPHGMPRKDNRKERAIAEAQLQIQLDLVQDFKGRPIFLPGHEDWDEYGLKGVKRQGKFIEKALNKGIGKIIFFQEKAVVVLKT